MTRDQAIEIEIKKLSKTGPFGGMDLVATANIDALIELGLLKVEEPIKFLLLDGKEYNMAQLASELFVQDIEYEVVKKKC